MSTHPPTFILCLDESRGSDGRLDQIDHVCGSRDEIEAMLESSIRRGCSDPEQIADHVVFEWVDGDEVATHRPRFIELDEHDFAIEWGVARRASVPASAVPGSEEKVATLEARYESGVPLWNPGDYRRPTE